MLVTHKQDEWDKFLFSLDTSDGSIYKLIKSLLNKRPATHPLMGPNGLTYSATDRSELFADTYQQKFTLNRGPILPEVNSSLTFINDAQVSSNDYTTPGFIKDIINHLPKRKAPGEDQITNNALKNAPNNFILRLTHIYNGCIRLSFFPDDWKRGQIITIPKPGKNHADPVSYRPITLLPTIAKIFKIIVLRKLKCKTEHLIRDEQFAFRQQHSTVLQLIKLTDQLCKNLVTTTILHRLFFSTWKKPSTRSGTKVYSTSCSNRCAGHCDHVPIII